MNSAETHRILPTGLPGARVHTRGVDYRVWAPDHASIAVCVRRVGGGEDRIALDATGDGFFQATDRGGRAGDRYAFELPDGTRLPDVASRFQPDGVHGWSECIDPGNYLWRPTGWQRPGWCGQSIYELHVGTFTGEGTFRAAIEKLPHLAALGVDAIELMPLADFAGAHNWGYDGVCLYAPARCYGSPDDLRALVDAAHTHGLAVILDAVYNHLGPDGNYLARYARGYFHPDRQTPWGQSFHLSGPHSRPVRDFLLGSVACWLDEYRFDGLRLDATHAIHDDSPRHILAEIADLVHERGAFLIAEDERNLRQTVQATAEGGCGIDAVWADDFHHQMRVALTGTRHAYFASYRGTTADLARTLEQGWFYTGQDYTAWGRARGAPADGLPPRTFVHCIENHDQVGNRARGERLEHLTSPAAFRAASALLCFGPYPPMLFMGQEWAADSPFLYFTDHYGELGRDVSAGRRREFAEFFAQEPVSDPAIPDPQAEETFQASKLRWDEIARAPHAEILALYQTCLACRRAWVAAAAAERERWSVAAVENAVTIRYRSRHGEPERLVIAALKGNASLALLLEPALQPPDGCGWRLEFDSNDEARDRDAPPGECPSGEGPGHPALFPVESLVFETPGTIVLAAEWYPAS